MFGPVMLRWLYERWAVVATVVAGVLLVGVGLRLLPRSDTSPIINPPALLGALAIQVLTEHATCEPSEADACGQAPTPSADAGMSAHALAGARVRVIATRGEQHVPWAEVVADTAGQARVPAAPGEYWVLVDAPGRARRSQRVTASSALARLVVRLPPAEPLDVSVRDGLGQPIAGATVLVRAEDELPHSALTSATGLARLEHAGRRIESVRVSAPGYDSALVNPTSRELTVELGAKAALEVVVLGASGQPAPDAEVWVSGADFWPPRQASVDAAGVARLEGLSRGTYDLRARLGTLVSGSEPSVTLERGQRERVTLRLAEGRFVSVLVVDGEGATAAPVPDAEVTLVEGGLSPFPLSARSATDGTCSLGPVPPGSAVLNVRADGFMPESLSVPREPAAPVRIALLRGGHVTGRVVDIEGRAIEGARLEVVGDDARGRPVARQSGARAASGGFFERTLAEPLPLVPMGELGVLSGPLPVPGMPPIGPAPTSAWVSDLDGNYRIDDVPPGRVRLIARHPDFVEASSELVSLEPGGEARVRLVLERGATLSGRLLDELGRPVARARIDALSSQRTPASALTDFDGTFTFRAVPARVDLLVARPEERQRFVLRRSVTLGPGESREIELRLPAERPPLRVVTRGEDGLPLAGATVALLSLEPTVPLRLSAESDARGETSLLDAVGIPATLRVQAPGYRLFETELDAVPAQIEVSLSRGVRVSGRVTQSGGREGVRGAQVVLLQAGQRRGATSDENGEYELSGVVLGPAALSIQHPKFSSGTWDVLIEPGVREGQAAPLEPLDLTEPGLASGTVVDAQGEPVRGARVGVGLVPAFVPVGARFPGFVETDERGRFELRGLEPGTVTLSAYAAGVGRGSLKNVVIASSERTRELEIRLNPTHSDAEASAIANVAVTLGERLVGADLEVVIVNVAAQSEAERAGVRQGDVLWSVDDEVVTDMADARALLGGSDGSDVILELWREEEAFLVRVRREPVR